MAFPPIRRPKLGIAEGAALKFPSLSGLKTAHVRVQESEKAAVAPGPSTVQIEKLNGRLRLVGNYNADFDLANFHGQLTEAGVTTPELEDLVDTWKTERDLATLARYFRQCRFAGVTVDVLSELTYQRPCPACPGGQLERHDGHGTVVCNVCRMSVVDNTPVVMYSGSMNGLGGTGPGCSSGPTVGDGSGDFGSTSSSSGDHSSGEDRDNFTRAWLAMHGMQNPKLPPDLFEQLDAYFIRDGRPSGEQVRAQPVIINMYGEQAKEGTSVEALHTALKSFKLKQSCYADEFYIRHVYWGWPLPNAFHVRERVFRNYDRTRAVYPFVDGARESSPNASYWLYQELRAAGYEISDHLFSLVRTANILEWHDHIRRQMCILASQDGDEPIEFFPLAT